jgi:hypothetical protein
MKHLLLIFLFTVSLLVADNKGSGAVDGKKNKSAKDTTAFAEKPAVTINSFTATQTDENTAILKWSVAFHGNVTSFEIQKKEKNESVWKTLTEGNSLFRTFTNHTDYHLTGPDSKYRIRIRDDKGKVYFSKVAEVKGDITAHSLYQNYPNPFNPSTSISYKVSTAGFVYLKVYNILGNEVATLVEDHKGPGIYKVDFDASTVPGGLSSGIYFYKLIIGDFVETKKMTFSK